MFIKIGQRACRKLDSLFDDKNMPTQASSEEEFRELPFKTKVAAIIWFLKVAFCFFVMAAVCLNIKSRWDQVL